MKDTTKRKMKKTIYAALVLSYILIITTVNTQAASGTLYWSDYTNIEYTEQDGREVTYRSYSEVGVTYTNTQVVNMEILITNPDEELYMYSMQDLSGFTITYNSTSYGAQFYQALYEVGIRDSVLNKYIYVQIRTQVEYLGSSQMRIKVRFNIPESSGVSMYSLLSNFHNSNTDMTDSYVTSWGMIILANAVIREDVTEGTVESRNIYYNGSYKTPIEIDNMITQNFNGTLNNIYDQIMQPFEPTDVNIPNGDKEVADTWDDMWNQQLNDEFFEDVITHMNIIQSGETFGYVHETLEKIAGLPFVASLLPIALLFIGARMVMH